jgi:anti-sigma factor RsiW
MMCWESGSLETIPCGMMRCLVHERFTLLMSLVLDGMATSQEQEELDRHLGLCSSCAAAWQDWQAVDRALSNAPTVVPTQRLAEAIEQKLSSNRRRRGMSDWLPVGLGMLWVSWVGAVGFVSIGLLWWGWRHPLEVAIMLSSGARLLSRVSGLMGGAEIAIASLLEPILGAWLAGWVLCAGGLLILLGCALYDAGDKGRTEQLHIAGGSSGR